MNKLLVGAVALAATIGAPVAYAADMPLKAAPPPVPAYTWTGCYAGFNVGGNFGRTKTSLGENRFSSLPTPVMVAPGTQAGNGIGQDGVIGGAQVGCNYQVGAWVLGAEGDFDATNADGQESVPLFPQVALRTTESWLATARARVGYAITDRWLGYVTAGGAWTRLEVNPFVRGTDRSLTQTKTIDGWTVGLGTEYALDQNWSIKGELLYVNFGTKDFFSPTGPLNTGLVIKQDNYVGRVGVNYKFW